MIGVSLGTISEALASQLGVDADGVVMIESVSDSMPAEQSGLRRFDIITSVDGQAPVSTPMLQRIIGSKRAGEAVRIEVLRGGDPHTFNVSVAAAPARREAQALLEKAVRERAEAGHLTAPSAPNAPSAIQNQARTELALTRAKERFEQQRERVKLRKESGGQEIAAILEKLSELDIELDDETMTQLKLHLARLGARFEDFNFTYEMPNIEFVPGDGEDEGIVVIEHAPDGRFFERHGNTIRFAPGGVGEVRFPVAPKGTPEPDHGVLFERNPQLNERLNTLEERMARIEKLLERLAERIDE